MLAFRLKAVHPPVVIQMEVIMLDMLKTVIATIIVVFAIGHSGAILSDDNFADYSSMQSRILAKFYALPTAPGGGF